MKTQLSKKKEETVLHRIKALLGPQSAPTSLGLLFILSLVHELSHARTGEESPETPELKLGDFSDVLANQADLQKIVEIIQEAYPEISDQLFGDQVTDLSLPDGAPLDVAAVSSELTALEASGYLNHEEALRLANALKALGDGGGASFQDVVAQAATDPVDGTTPAAGDAGTASPTAAEGAAEGGAAGAAGEDVAIEALPATGAGPLAFALGPVLAGGTAAAVVVASTGAAKTTTTPATPDTTAPTLVITDNVPGTANIASGALVYTFTFSEAVTGFTAADVTVANGAKGAFTAVSSTVYTLQVTPTANLEGNVTVSVAAGVAADAAGNANLAASTVVQAVDVKAPTALTFALTADTGSSSTDGITSNGQVTVDLTNLEAGATWQYSTNGGTSWTTGTGTNFTLSANTTFAAGSVQVRQTDVAGNTSSVTSSGTAITVDTTAPVIQPGITAHGGTSDLVLTYDSALDSIHTAAGGAFAVTVNGGAVVVNTVTVTGSTVTLTLASALVTSDVIVVTYTDPTVGNDANATQDLAGNDAVSVTSGRVADGYVRGAQIYIDANGDGVPQAGEIIAGVVTDANGNFFLPDGVSGSVMAVGGVNIDTGVPNTMVLKAPAGATMITPLTTLVQTYIENNAVTAAAANTAVLTVLGLTLPAGRTLSDYDPLAALARDPGNSQALDLQKAATQVATIVQLAASAPSGGNTAATTANSVIDNLVSAVTSAATGGTTVDLTATTTITNAVSTVSSVNVTTVENASQNIFDATSLLGVSTQQAVALDSTPPSAPTLALTAATDTGSSSSDGVTNVTAPVLRVSFNTTATDGSAVVAGNAVKVFDGVAQLGSTVTLTAANIANGYVDIPLSGLAANTAHALTSQITDLASHSSAASSAFSVTIDTILPSAPTIDLVAGNDNVNLAELNAGITISGTATAGVAVDIVWGDTTKSVIANGSGVWSTSIAASEVPADGSTTVVAEARDLAGNLSATHAARPVTILTGRIDSTAPDAPVVLAIATDNIINAAEKAAGVVVSGTAEAGATVTIIWGGIAFEPVIVAADGRWSRAFAPNEIPADGTSIINVNAFDASPAHNMSLGTTREITIDTATPTAPVITSATSDDIVNAAEKATGVLIDGTAEAGATVNLVWGTTTRSVVANEAGAWSTLFNSGDIPADGSTTISATARDAAGNTSAAATRAVTVDATVPGTPTINAVSGDDRVTLAEKPAGVAVSGTAEANASIAVTWGAVTNTVSANGSGVWSTTFTSGQLPAGGNTTISVTATDAAGNSTAATHAVTVNQALTGVTAGQVLTSGALGYVETMTLASGQTLNLTAADYLSNSVALGKITNAVGDYTLNVTGASAGNALSIGADARVDAITLLPAQSFTLTPSEYNGSLGAFAKINTPTSEYSVTLDVSAGTENSDIASLVASIDGATYGGHVDVLNLLDDTLSISDAQAASLVQAGLRFAAEDAVTENASVPGTGRQLLTSLSDLQRLGVDNVAITGASGAVGIASGADPVDFAHLPTVSAADGVLVGLEISAGNLAGVSLTDLAANAAALKAHGFDAIMADGGSLTLDAPQVSVFHTAGLQFDMADHITMRIASDVESTAIATVVSAIDSNPLHISGLDVLDLVDGGVDLTSAQAASLVTAGIQFAADDIGVTVNVDQHGHGTHLQTSLAQLQHLGVDTVAITGADPGVLQILAGSGADLGHNVPLIQELDPTVQVDLKVDASLLQGLDASTLHADAVALHTAGFDGLSVGGDLTLTPLQVDAIMSGGLGFNPADNVTMQFAAADGSQVISTLVTEIGAGHLQAGLDTLDVLGAGAALDITDAQAHSLIQAGLHFAADDQISVHLDHAAGTHLTTSLTDLQHLGVDYVHTDPGIDTVVVQWGSGAFTSHVLPVFDAEDNVKLVVDDTSLTQLRDFIPVMENNPNFDMLSVVLNSAIGNPAGLDGVGVLDPIFSSRGVVFELDVANSSLPEITLGMILDAADGSADSLHLLTGNGLVSALHTAGINDINIEQMSHFQVADTDLKPLMDAGLVKADPVADVMVTHAGEGTLDVTLAQLATIGADHVVQTSGTNLMVDAGVSFSGLSGLETALNQLLVAFEDGTGAINKQLFVDAGHTVDLHVAGTLSSSDHLSTELANKLQLLGIDHVVDDQAHQLKPT